MRKTPAIILAAIASVFCMSSCIHDDTILYNDLCMVSVETSTRLLTDGGEVFNVVESYVSDIPDTLRRVMIICDVLKKSGSAADEYDIRLRDFARVLSKPVVLKSTADEEALGSDAVGLVQAWTGDRYLNGAFTFTGLVNSPTVHLINLVLDDTKASQDTLFLSLRHNAFNESLEHDEAPASMLTVSSGYFSFPVEEYIPAGKESMVLHIDWSWYRTEFGQYVKEKEPGCIDITFKK